MVVDVGVARAMELRVFDVDQGDALEARVFGKRRNSSGALVLSDFLFQMDMDVR